MFKIKASVSEGKPIFQVVTGLGYGTFAAMALSSALKNSFVWICIHGILGWYYVIYAGVKLTVAILNTYLPI